MNRDAKTTLRIRVLVWLLASVVLAGCNSVDLSGQVDGWSIGEEVACAPEDARCRLMIDVATSRLGGRDPGHPPVVEVSLHAEGMYPNEQGGGMGMIIRSGGFPNVVVFVLADGSRRAIGVKYVLNDDIPTAYDHGPELRHGGGGGGAPASTP